MPVLDYDIVQVFSSAAGRGPATLHQSLILMPVVALILVPNPELRTHTSASPVPRRTSYDFFSLLVHVLVRFVRSFSRIV